MKTLQNIVDRIRNESLEKLSDPSYLEFKLLPELGLNDRHMNQYPSHLHQYCGNGVDSWQYPNQFSKYLHYLSKQNIKSYVEIGCHKGGTFIITVEYLRRFNQLDCCIAVDNWPRDRMNDYSGMCNEVEYWNTTSQAPEFAKLLKSRTWDLVLIDGDHSYRGVQDDYELVKQNTRIMAFHDIRNILCPGTQQIWQDVRAQYFNVHEWCDQYDEVLLRMRGSIMGIGLVHT